MSRSIRVAPQYIPQVKLALQRNGFPSQQALAEEVGLSRDTIRKFLNGKGIDYWNFTEICEKLELNWQDIVYKGDDAPEETPQQPSKEIDIDTLVQNVREKVKPFIQQECSTMRVLSMTFPIGVNDIYSHVNVLEIPTANLRLEIDELLQGFNDPSKFDGYGLSRSSEERIPGLKAVEEYPKLMVFGKPGAGKTTFLKYLALQCIDGKLQSDIVPIFITMKDFPEYGKEQTLLEYIIEQLSAYEIVAEEIEQLLKQGRTMVLLDGLDEVKEENSRYVFDEIKHFFKRYQQNRFVITCRIAAKEYILEKFTEVEVADFDSEQIDTFVKKWFDSSKDKKDQKEKKKENAKRFKENLERQPRIKELATNPLLLTLLCLVFEDKGEFFSRNRYEVYKEAVDTLLVKWDASRAIERENVYKNLSLGDKRDLLSYIALTTFEKGDYFLSKIDLEHLITNYIRNFPDAKTNVGDLESDSEAVLKSIQGQHGLLVERARGIYSFSHLTFLEYFTARRIATRPDPEVSKIAFSNLVKNITDKRWREVFLLAVVPLRPADYLLKLMKNKVDSLLAGDEKLQKFLKWVNEQSLEIQKSLPDKVSYKPAAIRSFYLDSDITIDPQRTLGFLIDFYCLCIFTCASFLCRTVNLSFKEALKIVLELKPDFTRYRAFDAATVMVFVRVFAINHALQIDPNIDPGLRKRLEELKAQVDKDEEKIIALEKEKGQDWAEQVRIQIVENHPIGEDWQFDEAQKELLTKYYEANVLLMACLNNAYVSHEVRQEIENNLLLPF
ncbi:NACHT domain-containing protein [Argonema antarcticum]|uniref:NACHT domain-containing protein n=1 Tax=Argonema antarcticum TaxID=2942763 RepID=UPI00201301B6|nr:NACHT domain-containing NTPase [Argonema antarcticum]MCL1471461.1 NACHT domain-containing NTPase [Argonema antarcticum A004/B2]